jgi:hypothetical protein
MHPNSHKTIAELIIKWTEGCTTVLDYGSRDVNGTFRDLFPDPWVYTGCDIEGGPNVDLVMEIDQPIPLESRSVDLVITGNTLEHVRNPFLVVYEMARVMKKVMIIGAPFKYDEHRYPLDCWRFLPDGMQALADYAGIKCEDTFIFEKDCYLVATR